MSACAEIPLEVWHIPTVTDTNTLDGLSHLLSPAEQQRAQHTIKDAVRHTYITSHAAMRMILGKYLQKSPQSLEFIPHQNGKPSLEGPACLHFNLSHTHDYALLGISSKCHVGIDIEVIKPGRDILAIAKRFFSDDEYNWLANTATQQRYECFFQLWCHKEAYLKALGLGLQGGLSSFSLSKDDLDTSCSIEDGSKQRWWIQALKVPDPYRAALAVNCRDIAPQEHHWVSEEFF
jgi:4'-phosphopantetheinyl transferase